MKPNFSVILILLLFTFNSNGFAQIKNLDYLSSDIFSRPSTPPFLKIWDIIPKEIKSRNSFRRLEWFYTPRLNQYGFYPKQFIEEQREREFLKSQQVQDNMNYQWVNLGPVGVDMSQTEVPHWGINSGRIRGLAIHPLNPDIVYLGAASGGIWKSTNGGINWTDISGELNRITFGSIEIDKNNPDVLYAGTGESTWYINYNIYNGDGLYKSTDAGGHWIKITNDFGAQTHFSDIAVSPHNSNIIMAALAVSYLNPYPNQGIWRSTNAGVNWTRVLDITGAFDIAFNPVDPNLVYAATGNKQPQGGFLISTNGGVNFFQSNSGLPPYTSMGRLQFDISQSNPSILYLLVHDIPPVSGGMSTCVYKSINGGSSWFQISSGVNIAGTYDGTTAFDQGDYDLCISVNPANPDKVFTGNVEMCRTINGSDFSFVRKPDGPSGGATALDCYTHLDIHIIKFAPSNPSIVYAGCDGGIYKSVNGGQTFSHFNNGINSMQMYTVASHPSNPDIIYGGAQDNGGFCTLDRGASAWMDKVSGDGMKCFFDYSNPDIAFIVTVFGTLNRTTNAGLNWTEVLPPDADSTSFRDIYWQHPVNPNIIYGAYKQRIYKSTDKGTTWEFTTQNAISDNQIYSAAQSKVTPANMMIITNESPAKVFRSSDEGYTWINITTNGNFAGASLMNIRPDPVNGQTFYITRGSYNEGQILKTTNFGNSWIDISSDLPKIPVSDVFVDADESGVMYLGNDFGVYRTTNSGGSWQRMNNGIPFLPVTEFNLFSSGGIKLLRAATYGRGVFELNLNQPIFVNEQGLNAPAQFELLQNYPNPFNPDTKISFRLPADSKVTLTVYNLSGKEISRLVSSRNMKAGNHSVKFSAGDLSSGIYIYRLTAGDFTQSKKMILIK